MAATQAGRVRDELVRLSARGLDIASFFEESGRALRVWRPNYTVPVADNMTGSTMGFVTELAHFREVVTEDAPNESDLASAAATLRLTSEIALLAAPG